MYCYFHLDFNKHETLDSSFENETRISQVLSLIPEKYKIECKFRNNFNDKKIKIVEEYFNYLSFWNCTKCSYKNPKERKACEICEENNIKNIKLVSKIEGDTTCISQNSMECLNKNLQTIYYTLDSQIKDGNDSFILIRPPGHHSSFCKDSITIDPQGFCILNNISFGVDYLLKKYNFKKVAIIDWDVHHGNGTQEIFYKTNEVLFIDLHRYDGRFYPGTGKEDEIGEDEGKGFTINIPLLKGSGEIEYIEKFETVVIPRLKEYEPEWIFVSCGFDAHKEDPLGGMNLQDESYLKFYKLLKNIKKPITMFLEGGYNSEVISRCVNKILNF